MYSYLKPLLIITSVLASQRFLASCHPVEYHGNDLPVASTFEGPLNHFEEYDRENDSWEFHVSNYSATYRSPGHLGNLTIDFCVQDMFNDPKSTPITAHCSATFRPARLHANGSMTGYPSKTKPAGCADDKGWSWYFAAFQSAGEFSLNLVHRAIKERVGPRTSIYFGTGPAIDWDTTDPAIEEYCTGSGYCDYWLNSTMVVPITSAIG